MVTISLLVTGKTELLALADSLAQVFRADFRYANPLSADPERYLRGFTSPDLRNVSGKKVSPESDLGWFVAHLVGGAFPGRHGKPPDLMIGLDDLEVHNAHQADLAVRLVRDAVRDHVERSFSGPVRDRVYQRLREHCSFHLLKPMVEAYFFGEPAALDRAGVPPRRASEFDPAACDPEDFHVSDAGYMTVPEPPRPKRRNSTYKNDWRRQQETRPYHPKKYLKYLYDPRCDGCETWPPPRDSVLRNL